MDGVAVIESLYNVRKRSRQKKQRNRAKKGTTKPHITQNNKDM